MSGHRYQSWFSIVVWKTHAQEWWDVGPPEKWIACGDQSYCGSEAWENWPACLEMASGPGWVPDPRHQSRGVSQGSSTTFHSGRGKSTCDLEITVVMLRLQAIWEEKPHSAGAWFKSGHMCFNKLFRRLYQVFFLGPHESRSIMNLGGLCIEQLLKDLWQTRPSHNAVSALPWAGYPDRRLKRLHNV